MPQPLSNPVKPAVPVQEPHEVEIARKRELLKKVRHMRSNAMETMAKVRSKDPAKQLNPNIHYVWVNRNEHRIVHFQSLGYKVCTDPEVMTAWKKEDGTHAYGDLILMEIDRELYEAHKLDSQLRAVEGVEGEQLFVSFAERAGIPVQVNA